MKISLKLILSVSFRLNVATGKFKITCVAHFMFLLGSTVIEHIRFMFLKSGIFKNYFP